MKKIFRKISVLFFSLLAMVIFIPAMSAFEAHVVGVTATIAQIDAPEFDPLSNEISGPTTVNITDADIDATHIFYTFAESTSNPDDVPNPVCGGNGGEKPQSLSISQSAVIKAIACDGSSASAHSSAISIKIYTFVAPPEQEPPHHGPENPGDTLPEQASDVAEEHAQGGLSHPNSSSTPHTTLPNDELIITVPPPQSKPSAAPSTSTQPTTTTTTSTN